MPGIAEEPPTGSGRRLFAQPERGRASGETDSCANLPLSTYRIPDTAEAQEHGAPSRRLGNAARRRINDRIAGRVRVARKAERLIILQHGLIEAPLHHLSSGKIALDADRRAGAMVESGIAERGLRLPHQDVAGRLVKHGLKFDLRAPD